MLLIHDGATSVLSLITCAHAVVLVIILVIIAMKFERCHNIYMLTSMTGDIQPPVNSCSEMSQKNAVIPSFLLRGDIAVQVVNALGVCLL